MQKPGKTREAMSGCTRAKFCHHEQAKLDHCVRAKLDCTQGKLDCTQAKLDHCRRAMLGCTQAMLGCTQAKLGTRMSRRQKKSPQRT